jgi:beta-phosphoglucomutase
MKKMAVIFDMDGVIVDSEPFYMIWNKDLFKKLQIQVDDDTLHGFIGGTAKRKWEILKARFSLPHHIEELIQLEKDLFSKKQWDFKQILRPDVIPFLEKLKEERIPVALASSSEMSRINEVLEQCKLRKYFDVIVSGEDFERSKPHPDIFLNAAEKLGVLNTNCIVIEDSYNGLTAAKRANMYGIGIRHKQIKMDLTQADRIVDSLSEIDIRDLQGLKLSLH